MSGIGGAFGTLMEAMNRPVYAFALDRLSPSQNDAILEIGCGNGALIALLTPKIHNGLIAGIDPSRQIIDAATKRHPAANIDLRVGSVDSLPWADQTFSKATALHSFHFWSDPEANLKEVLRVLQPGGLLLLVLRYHEKAARSERLANPISRTADEVGGTLEALRNAGFCDAQQEGQIGTSAVVTAKRPAASVSSNE